ncbi:MAG TPA: macro domain-containing protein, partial [Actinomycetales bacterium]|nr:macro domain-containing protein [Actinomycetales bacterium]
ELRDTSLPDGLPTGDAVATTAGRLLARWVIHAVGPVYSRSEDRSHLLASAYRRSLEVAVSVGAQTVAFPAISAGVYGWPLEDAARIAISTVRKEITDGAAQDVIRSVTFVLFTAELYEFFARELKSA